MADEVARYSELLPPVASSVAAARKFVVAAARSWGVTALANDLALVVSELVTNAIEHGVGPVGLAARRWGDGVQIEVSSGLTSHRPARLDPSPRMATGRGRRVVDALASDWGHRESRLQRTVWARLTEAPGAREDD